MNILVINCGSSSLKFQLIDMTTEAVQAKGLWVKELALTAAVLFTHQQAVRR